MRYLVKRIPSTSLVQYDGSRYYCEIAGGTAEKATVDTTGLLAGSKYLDVQTGTWYVYDELTNAWAVSAEGGSADPAVVEAAVEAWLDAHPEATTTVQDGSISYAKLDTTLKGKADAVTTLSDEIVDVKSTLSQRTKNLFDPSWLNSGITKDGEWYSGTGLNWAASVSTFTGEANTQYTLSLIVKAGNAGAIKFIFNYSDGTSDTLTTSANLSADTLAKKTTASGKTVSSITFSYGGSGSAVNKAKDIQLEQGANATSYEPFLTAYDFLATQRLNQIESLGLDSYPQIKNCAFGSSKYFKQISFTTGQKLQTDGRIVSDAAYAITDYIFLASGESITYDVTTYHTNACVVGKFDLNKSNLTVIVSNAEAAYTEHSSTYTADADCYIIICGMPGYKHIAQYTGFVNPIQQLAKVTAQNTFKAYSQFVDVEFTDDVRIDSSGHETTTNEYSATGFIYLGVGESLYYSVTNTNVNTAVLSVYDLYQSWIETLVTHSSGDPDIKSGTYTATQDCFVRICGRKAYAHTANYTGIKTSVTKRLDEIESVLPSYWEAYLESKKSDINTFISGIGNTGDYFALFTDYHYIQNAGWTPRIIKNLFHDYPIETVMNLGDNYNSETTAELAIERLNSIMALFKPIKLLNCIGNHDENPYGVQLTLAQYYNPLFKDTEMYSHSVQTGGGYYYIDNEPHKIRYIFLNTRANGFTEDDKTTQLPWFVDVLNSVADGWYVCVLMHIFFDWQHNSETDEDFLAISAGAVIKNLCDAYQNRGTGTEPTKSIEYDFTNAHGKIACILSGHTHKEHYVTSTAGYTIISFDRDGYNYPPPPGDETPRTKGTVSEQAIYFVGINTNTKKVKVLGLGAGSDMEFDFD